MLELKKSRKTYLGNGRWQLECFGNPVQMREDGGEWLDISPTFSLDGKITGAPYELSVDFANKAFTLKDKVTGKVASIKLSTIFGNLPPQAKVPFLDVKPAVFKNTIIWADIVKGVDAVIVAHNTGVSFKRIIKNKDAPHKAQFTIDGDIPVRYQAYDKRGEPIAISVSKEGTLVTEDFEAEEDQYPIVIDPTLTVQPSAKDCFLSSHVPDANSGTGTALQIVDYSSQIRRILAELDISELPVGATLESALLYLYYFQYYTDRNDPVGRTVWAYKLTRTDWVEDEATWNSYKTGNAWTNPGGDYVTSDPSGGSTTVPASFGWMSWDVVTIVQDAYDASKDAEFLVKFADESKAWADCSYPYFRSKEYTDDPDLQPKLVITYAIPLIPVADGDLIGIAIIRQGREAEMAIPSGLIAMWHGAITDIPAGWVICDGNNGTPNLLARFVQGVATAATDPGATGGTSTHYHGPGATGTPNLLHLEVGSEFYTDVRSHIPPFYDIAFIMKT